MDTSTCLIFLVVVVLVILAVIWFRRRGKSSAAQITSSASSAVSSASTTVKDTAAGAGAAVTGATAGAVSMTKDTASGAANMTQDAAAGVGSMTQDATAAVAGAAGALGMDQMMGALSGILGGGQLDANSALGQMITPIADGMTKKLGLPKEVGAMVVAFALAKIGEMIKSKGAAPAGGAGGVNTDEVLGKLNSGGGVDAGALDSMGLSQELADKTGLTKDQAGQGLQYAMGALSAGMAGQKSFEGMDLPDMSMLTGMMK